MYIYEETEYFVVRSTAKEMKRKLEELPDDIRSYRFIGIWAEGDSNIEIDYDYIRLMGTKGETFLYRVVPKPDGRFAGLDGHYECWAQVESESTMRRKSEKSKSQE